MATSTSITPKKGKHERERDVLLGLVDFYLKTGKAVGSNTLKEAGFDNLSSATIRNYFSTLEEEGYLSQQHTSGGRIPTDKALRLYAHHFFEELYDPFSTEIDALRPFKNVETREIATYLQKAADQLARITHSAIFMSAPHFEHDYITSIKLAPVDNDRAVAILTTDFGEIHTQVIHVPVKLSTFLIKKAEGYFQWRLQGKAKPENLTHAEEEFAQNIYNELLVRYIANYGNFQDNDLYRTGFSSLLIYPEYRDPSILANAFSLFENAHGLRQLLKESEKLDSLKFWIGDDLVSHAQSDKPSCAAIAIPYYVNNQAAGAVGILGPTRMPYRALFGILRHFSHLISETLTNNLYKFKITLRQPRSKFLHDDSEIKLIGDTHRLLLEHKLAKPSSRAAKTKEKTRRTS